MKSKKTCDGHRDQITFEEITKDSTLMFIISYYFLSDRAKIMFNLAFQILRDMNDHQIYDIIEYLIGRIKQVHIDDSEATRELNIALENIKSLKKDSLH